MKSKKKKRLSANKARLALQFCINRDGRRCAICGRFISTDTDDSRSLKAVLHHIDNNPSNNPKDGSNWQAVCKRDNYLSNPRRKKDEAAVDIQETVYVRESSAELRKSERMFPKFCHWLHSYLMQSNRIEYETCINTAADITGGSQITMQRYLDKITYPKSLKGWVFTSLDDTVDQVFIYLRTKTMQPVDASLIPNNDTNSTGPSKE
jgi:hypothetical protein